MNTFEHGAAASGRANKASPDFIKARLEALMCPFCERGPFNVPALHVSQMHGINKQDLRDLAGVSYGTRYVSDESLDHYIENGKARAGRLGPDFWQASVERRRKYGRRIGPGFEAALKASGSRLKAEERQRRERANVELRALWESSERDWASLVRIARTLERANKSVRAHLARLGYSVPDGRSETMRRRTNYSARKPCKEAGCEELTVGRGWCRKHYREFFVKPQREAGQR